MDVAEKVAQFLLSTQPNVAVLCKPDGADTICAYGILKVLPLVVASMKRHGASQLLFFHCCLDLEVYTDCMSSEILLHRLQRVQGSRIVFIINCYDDRIKAAQTEVPLDPDAKVVVMDSQWSRQRRPHVAEEPFYFLGGTEEEVLRRIYERDLRMRLPCYRYHGTPASFMAYQLCTSMTPSFRHPNALWRAMVGCADAFQRKRLHRDQYTHIHSAFIQEVESASSMQSIEECHETCLNFFQQSSLWDALHMSPHLYEQFDEIGFQDFVANTLGFPQHIAEYAYYQFITGPGDAIWEKLQVSGHLFGVQDMVLCGFQRTLSEKFVIHSMDHALAVNLALWRARSEQYGADCICIHEIFKCGEEVMGKPQETIPRYVQLLKSDCDARRKKCDVTLF